MERLPCATALDAAGIGLRQRTSEPRRSGLSAQCLVFILWSAHTEDTTRSGRTSWERSAHCLFICYLIRKRVNQKPQWGERMQGNGYWCKAAKDVFSPLCICLSCFHAFVCFMGFLIKTLKACVVHDIGNVLEWRSVSWPVQWVAGCSPPYSHCRLDPSFIFCLKMNLPLRRLIFAILLKLSS